MPDRKRAVAQKRDAMRQKLESTLARYEAVLASTLDPVITIDCFGTVISASRSVQRVFGYAPDELVGRNVSILMPEPHRSDHDEYLARYRRTGETNILGRTREFEALRRDGSRVPIEISVSRVDVPGQRLPLFTGIIHDISERKEIETRLAHYQQELEAKVRERTSELERTHDKLRMADRLASIGTLAAGLGHDMNNVLLPIRCRLDALDSIPLSDAAREQVQAIRRSIGYLQQLTDGLRMLALDPEDAGVANEATSIPQWWEQVGVLLQTAVPRNIALHTSLPADLPPVAVGSHRLTQAVLNLVVNAVEAMPDGGAIWIRAESLPGGRLVRLSVQDNGPGMPEEVRQRALDPFYTTKKRGLGTGLGLSLVRGVAKSAGGAVEIDSAPGRGTTITLSLQSVETGPVLPAGAASSRAVVAVSDPRTASLITACARACGLATTAAEPAALATCPLWIVEPRDALLEAARARRNAGRPPLLITLGPPLSEWTSLGAVSIDPPDDFEKIRSAIGSAVQELPGGHW